MTTPAQPSGPDIPAGYRIVEVSKEPVELYKILKFEGLVSNGGQAKAAVAAGQVLVNGVVETQKRKKIMSGDTIEFNADKISIRNTGAAVEQSEQVSTPAK
jgi:ribosome-associated protein